MREYSLAVQTMFAELTQQALDAEFDDTYIEQGNFKRRKKGGRYYWYFQWDADGRKHERYVGPVKDKSITDRVARFESVKQDYRTRRELVRSLIAAGMQVPIPPTGQIVEAMWKAGFFRLRGVLIGTVAYACYEGLLGVKLSGAATRTQDADFAQFWGVSENIGESIAHPLEILKSVDPSFKEIPTINDPFVTYRYSNTRKFKVEFLTPNRGSDEYQGRLAKMKALADSGAQPLRHLDYLIHQPERSVMLFGGGIPVSIPRAERYAVHKIIVAVERDDQTKAPKDLMQSAELIDVLSVRRPLELAEAWTLAWSTGARWQEKLASGKERLPKDAQIALDEVLSRSSTRRLGRPKNDNETRTYENEVAMAVLQICSEADDGIESISKLREKIPNYLKLTERDLQPSETRKNEAVWEQIVRNIISHKHNPGNIIAEGYAIHLPGAIGITDIGRAFLTRQGLKLARED